MVEEIKLLAALIDYPVTVMGFVWALRMIQSMNKDMQELLERCLAMHMSK